MTLMDVYDNQIAIGVEFEIYRVVSIQIFYWGTKDAIGRLSLTQDHLHIDFIITFLSHN